MADETPAPIPRDDDDKVTLTKAELEAERESIRKAARESAAEDEKKRREHEQEQRDEDEAKRKGEFEKLANSEKEKREAAERELQAAKLENKRLAVRDRLSRHVAEKHKEYVGCIDYMMHDLRFDADTKDAEIEKQIEAAAKRYAELNPRKVTSQPPEAPGRSGGNPNNRFSNRHSRPAASVASSRF